MIKPISCNPNKPCKLNLEPIKIPSDCTSFKGGNAKITEAVSDGILNSRAFNKIKAKVLTAVLIVCSWFAGKSIFKVIKGNQKKA